MGLKGIIDSIPFPSRPSFLKGGVTNRSNSTSISSGLGSSISNNNTSSPPSYSRIIPPSLANNRATNSSVHSNSPKLGNDTITTPKNESNLGQHQTQSVATRSASVPSGASALKHQQRSLPAPPVENKPGSEIEREETESRERNRLPSTFYQNRGDYFTIVEGLFIFFSVNLLSWHFLSFCEIMKLWPFPIMIIFTGFGSPSSIRILTFLFIRFEKAYYSINLIMSKDSLV